MSKFERRFGKYAIKNISMVLILCYAAGFVINMINSSFLNYLSLNPYAIIFDFQIWRLFTWIIIPPTLESNLFFILIMLYFYYSIGTSLEHAWGTYRYNVYLLSGMVFTVIGAFLLLVYDCISTPGLFSNMIFVNGAEASGYEFLAADIESYYIINSKTFSTYYVNMSIFLAYAATFAEARVMLFFVIPIKVKVLGIIYAVILGLELFTGPLPNKFAIGASLMNFVIFFIRSRGRVRMTPKQVKRRYEFRQEIKKDTRIARHRCAICGITEEQDPTMEFRFCSKCEGNYEYCSRHLYTHSHVKADRSPERYGTVHYDSDES